MSPYHSTPSEYNYYGEPYTQAQHPHSLHSAGPGAASHASHAGHPYSHGPYHHSMSSGNLKSYEEEANGPRPERSESGAGSKNNSRRGKNKSGGLAAAHAVTVDTEYYGGSQTDLSPHRITREGSVGSNFLSNEVGKMINQNKRYMGFISKVLLGKGYGFIESYELRKNFWWGLGRYSF